MTNDLPVRLFLATKAFIRHKDRVLILRESNKYIDGVQTGKFDVPGGRMTVMGEHFIDSLKREVREEAGLTIRNISSFFVNEFRVTKKDEIWQIVAMYFKADSDTDQVILSEDHGEYAWIDPGKYRDYPMIENLCAVFDAYNSGVNTIA